MTRFTAHPPNETAANERTTALVAEIESGAYSEANLEMLKAAIEAALKPSTVAPAASPGSGGTNTESMKLSTNSIMRFQKGGLLGPGLQGLDEAQRLAQEWHRIQNTRIAQGSRVGLERYVEINMARSKDRAKARSDA